VGGTFSCVIHRKFLVSSRDSGEDFGGEVWEKKDLLWGGEEEIGI